MLFLNSPITNCTIPVCAMLSKNISHGTFAGKSLLLGSLCTSGIQWSFTFSWKLTCLGFISTTLKIIAEAVPFPASSWQC